MESVTLGDLMDYVKTPYFVGFCIIILLLIIYKYKDSFTAAITPKPAKPEEIDDLIASIHKKQERLKRSKK
jgi:hypothetical protein